MAKDLGRLLTAMLTPFTSDGAVDYQAAEKLAALLVADGSDGVVVSGTTGESPTLSDDEKIELLKVIRKAIPGKTVVAGTGSNDTHHSVKLSERAMKAGADALLAVVPYYNKPPQEGMYQHFKAISEVGPTIMYNIQGRTAVNMTASTSDFLVRRASRHSRSQGSQRRPRPDWARVRWQAEAVQGLGRRRQLDPARDVGRRIRRDLRGFAHRGPVDEEDDRGSPRRARTTSRARSTSASCP